MKTRFATLGLVCLLAGMCHFGRAQDNIADRDTGRSHTSNRSAQEAQAAASLDLEDLVNMEVKVTSASKKEEALAGAAAAIYVITNDDIRHGGYSSLPEVLRVVPGMTVQQVNSHSWTVSTRGFNGFPNEKMLVLIDGRAVYDPLYGGVDWDVQDVRLEDVDRIEVIRGPGGALWGANAVNGVINVITKSAKQTQGLSVATSIGHDEGYQGSIRVGAQAGKRFYYRVYAKGGSWEPFVNSGDAELFNAWDLSSGGFRADWTVSDKDVLTLSGAGYQGHIHDTALVTTDTFHGAVNDPYLVQGGHILGHWDHTFSERSNTEVVAYCDWTNRTDIEFAAEYRNTCNVDLQHNLQINQRNSINWGGGFRSTADQTRATPDNHFIPPDERVNLVNGFGQYEFDVVPNRLRVIGGSKFEHNTYTGFEIQPQARAVWTPAKNHNIWGAVSRSVRTPTHNEHGTFKFGLMTPASASAPLTILGWLGNPNLRAEHQNAYELGYRYQYQQTLSFDATAFYNSYSDLLYPDMLHPVTFTFTDPTYIVLAWTITNNERAQTHGLEISAKWRPIHPWQVSLGVTEDRGTGISMYATSRHQFNVESRLNLPRHFALNSALFHVNKISVLAMTPVAVPTTNRVDVGLSWHALSGLSVGIWGRNLQSERHPEGSGSFLSTGEVRRSVVVRLAWEFVPEKKNTN